MLSRLVAPPCPQCNTWCAFVQDVGRSQPDQTHPPSRTRSALRAAPEGTRNARPTSITAESCPISTRRMVASHARRCTVAAGTAPANSRSPPGAPLSPATVSSDAELEVGAICAVVSGEAMVERVGRELHQCVCVPSSTRPVVTCTGGLAEGRKRNAQGCTTHWIEQPTYRNPAVLTPGELETPVLNRGDMLREHRGSVRHVARVRAIKREAAHRVFHGEVEQGTLVKSGIAGRTSDRARSAASNAR